MLFLPGTRRGSKLSIVLLLFCIGVLVLLPDTHPFAKSFPLGNNTYIPGTNLNSPDNKTRYSRNILLSPAYADSLVAVYINKCYDLEQVYAKNTEVSIWKSFMTLCEQIESLADNVTRSDFTMIEKDRILLQFQKFYTLAIKICYQANDVSRLFHYIELSRLLHDPEMNFAATTISLDRLQHELLKKRQQFLSYFEDGDCIYALYLNGKDNTCKRIDFPGYLDTVRQFNALCSDRQLLNANYFNYARIAYLLYQKLIAPVNVNPGNLMISPGKHFIPFDALTTDREGGDFLLYHFAISYTHSATRQFLIPEHSSIGDIDFLGIAPEFYSSNVALPRLFGAVKSLQKIEDCFANAAILSQQTASRKSFLRSMGNCSVLHIYSHAGVHSTQPVLFLHDNPVYMDDINLAKQNRLQLIFLAGCETAVAGIGNGIENYSLADKFVYAGVPSTIATLWQGENKAVYTISETFYRLLKLGVPRNQALQQAKIEFVKKRIKANQLPYFWASVILFGDTTPLTSTPAKQNMFSFAAILNIGLFAFSRRLVHNAGNR